MSLERHLGAGGACLVLGLTCLSFLATASSAGATTLRRMDLPEMVATADRVFHARVADNRVYWDPTNRQILTDTIFEVIIDAKGQGPKKLTIAQLGGRIYPYEMLVEGTPAFSAGEEVVLFTELHPSGNRTIVGMSQGVMRVHRDPDTGDRIAVSAVPGGVSIVGGKPHRSAAPLDALLEHVRQMAAGGRQGPSLSKTAERPEAAPPGGKP